MGLSKAIGIISYLPDVIEKKAYRLLKLKNLIDKCAKLFNLPVIIIAQNWPKNLLEEYHNLEIYYYDKPLTIVGARKELRKVFLEKYNYEYLIMLDDDCEIEGNSANNYLQQIDDNPDCWIVFSATRDLKLFAISRSIFSQIDYDEIYPEYGEGYEDWVFFEKLNVFYPKNKRYFKETGLKELSKTAYDAYSTWYTKDISLSELNIKTIKLIEKYNPNCSIQDIFKR